MTVAAGQDVMNGELTELQQLLEVTGCGLTAKQVSAHITSVEVTNEGSKLSYWPPALCHFRQLRSINLSGNAITFIPQAIQNLAGLEELVLSRNCLTSLPPEVSCLTALTELDVSRNQLTALPAALCSLSGLQVLNAMGNQLTGLPDDFGRLRSLIRLGLKSNKLTNLPGSFCELGSLVELFITDNQLSTLPDGFGQLSSLVKLQASFNPWTHLPASLFDGLKELEMFRLAVGQLQQWPPGLAEAGALPKLAWCSLGSNAGAALPIKSLPAALPRVLKDDLEVGQKLGAGASGEVFLGRYEGQEVAVKLFVEGTSVSPDGCIEEEMGISCSIDHAHLTKVLALVVREGRTDGGADGVRPPPAAGDPGEVAGLVLELVRGKPLAARPTSQHLLRCKWAEGQQFSLGFVLEVLRGVSSGLAYLHRNQIAHGDIYAHNLLIEPNGHAVLCDFGAAFCYPADSGRFWEAMEVRAFGLLLHDLLVRVEAQRDSGVARQLQQLEQRCLQADAMQRPPFAEVEALLLQLGAGV